MSDDGDDVPAAGSRRGRRRLLSEEDRRLWDHVARSVTPVRRTARALDVPTPGVGRNSTPNNVETKLDPRAETRAEFQRRLEQGIVFVGSDAAGEPKIRITHAPHRPPPVAEFDRKAVRRLRSGRTEIEARIDLHGMRQDEAYRTLRRFLFGCHDRGVRWVLVITGKGRPGSAYGDGGQRGEPVPTWRDDERGVLKRNVPRWLAEPELRGIVISYTTASPSHGGEGALYIQLRARR
ncbi:MAG: Smr/MutS family protein [Hyphomicrobiaceae bacterium]